MEVASNFRKILNINPSRTEQQELKTTKGKSPNSNLHRKGSTSKVASDDNKPSTSKTEVNEKENVVKTSSPSIPENQLEKNKDGNKEKSIEQGIASVGGKLAAIAVKKEINSLSPVVNKKDGETIQYEMAADEV